MMSQAARSRSGFHYVILDVEANSMKRMIVQTFSFLFLAVNSLLSRSFVTTGSESLRVSSSTDAPSTIDFT